MKCKNCGESISKCFFCEKIFDVGEKIVCRHLGDETDGHHDHYCSEVAALTEQDDTHKLTRVIEDENQNTL